MKTTNYAIYKRTFNGNEFANDELVGSPTKFENAVAICALIVYNAKDNLLCDETSDDIENYCYIVFPMDKEGEVDLSKKLYQTEYYYK